MEPETPSSSWTLNVDFCPGALFPQNAITPVVEVLIQAEIVLDVDPVIPL